MQGNGINFVLEALKRSQNLAQSFITSSFHVINKQYRLNHCAAKNLQLQANWLDQKPATFDHTTTERDICQMKVIMNH